MYLSVKRFWGQICPQFPKKELASFDKMLNIIQIWQLIIKDFLAFDFFFRLIYIFFSSCWYVHVLYAFPLTHEIALVCVKILLDKKIIVLNLYRYVNRFSTRFHP